MDLSHDPHRGGISDLHLVSQELKRKSSSSHQSSGNITNLLHRSGRNVAADPLLSEATLHEDLIGANNAESSLINSSNAGKTGQNRDQSLSSSWLLVLIVAPVIIVLLVWLLILLRRRLEQCRHLVSSFGCLTSLDFKENGDDDNRENLEQSSSLRLSHRHEKQQEQHNQYHLSSGKTSSSKIKSQRATNAHYLLESSSSNSSTSSSSSASTSTSSDCLPPLSGSAQQDATTTTTTISAQTNGCRQAMPRTWQRGQPDRSAETMRSLVDHMGIFLLTLTYQEIVGCLVALAIAILNVIRMRNLFCCNLVVFALITSRLLNLLTLTTFSLTKLIKLFKLQVVVTTTCSPVVATTLPILSSSSSSSSPTLQASADSATNNSNLPVSNSSRNKANNNKPKLKKLSRSKQAEQREGASRESVAGSLLLLILMSAFLALVFLYLRLSSPTRGSLIVLNGDQSASAANVNRTTLDGGADWSISIFAPSTTTEASTRYTNGPDIETAPRLIGASLSESNTSDRHSNSQQPNYLASWSARFQQSSSLRHLLDQYEMQHFINLLLDTHLQTSRFTCTLAASNYAPIARVAMLAIYSTLMIAIVIAGIAIQQVGRKRLNQFKRHKLFNGFSGSFDDDGDDEEDDDDDDDIDIPLNYKQHLSHHHHHHHHHYPISFTKLDTIQEPTNSNRKRYTDLLRQTIRHQSSLEMSHREQQNELLAFGASRRALVNGGAGNRQRLRNASSMSSLLVPHSNLCASAERIPQQVHPNLKHDHHQQQQLDLHVHQQRLLNQQHLMNTNNRYPAGYRHGKQLRRLISAQSMANLTAGQRSMPAGQASGGCEHLRSSSSIAKISAGKFGNGQLAWLPLSSAATVASLSNIGRESEPTEQSAAINISKSNNHNNKCSIERDTSSGRCARSRLSGGSPTSASATSASAVQQVKSSHCNRQVASWCQAATTTATTNTPASNNNQQQRERLGSIGEHLVDFASLAERDEETKEVAAAAGQLSRTGNPSGDDCSASNEEDANANEEAIEASSKFSAAKDEAAAPSNSRQQVVRLAGVGGFVDGRAEAYDNGDFSGNQCQQRKGLRASRRAVGAASAIGVNVAVSMGNISEQQQQQQQHETKVGVADWPPLYSNQHRQQVAARNGIYYSELKRDLRLAQSVILFGQLLNHAPILILLAMANMLPDGLMAGWNSSHDNGFVWLTLIEALAFPVVLCAIDSRLAKGLRRSLSCSTVAGRRRATATAFHQQPGAGNTYSTRATSSGSCNLLDSKARKLHLPLRVQAGTGARLAHFNSNEAQRSNGCLPGAPTNQQQQQQSGELVLGPSASYPDFMFVCQAGQSAKHGNQPAELRLAKNSSCRPKPSLAPVLGSLTGPPYPYPLLMAQPMNNLRDQLAIDKSLRDANFALSIKPSLRNGSSILGALNNTSNSQSGQLNLDCIGTADLMASRRARYAELLAGDERRRRKRARRRAAGRCAGSAILRLTRRLLSFGGRRSRPAKCNRSKNAKSSYGYSAASSNTGSGTDNAACNTLAGRCAAGSAGQLELGVGFSGGSGGRGISPTSSLSTLIRKFNYDNYTSVCQQYEQRRKKDIALEQYALKSCASTEREASGRTSNNPNSNTVESDNSAEALLIDGLDGPTRSLSSNKRLRTATIVQRPVLPVGGDAIKAAPSDDKQANNNNNANKCLLDSEEGVFCRKGGLSYNYCLNDNADNLDFIHLEERSVARLNPMLHNAAGSGSGARSLASLMKANNNRAASPAIIKTNQPTGSVHHLINQQAVEDKAEELIDCSAAKNASLLCDVFQAAPQTKPPLTSASQQSLPSAIDELGVSVANSSSGIKQCSRQVNRSGSNRSNGRHSAIDRAANGDCKRQSLDAQNEDSKTTQAMFMVPVEHIELAATATTTTTSSSVNNNAQQQRQSGKPLDKRLGSPQTVATGAQVKSGSASQVGRLEKAINGSSNNNNNNEPIISNITSVQELLDKMNGIIATSQVEAATVAADHHGSSTKNNNNRATQANNSNHISSNKAALSKHLLNKACNDNDKQANTCANQLRQLELALATSGGHHNLNHNNNNQSSNTNTLEQADYASLRSIDDTLSLVSVSSEFEYHNINAACNISMSATNNNNDSTSDNSKQRIAATCSNSQLGSKNSQVVTASANLEGPKRWPESGGKSAVEGDSYKDFGLEARKRLFSEEREATNVRCSKPQQQQQLQVNESHHQREWPGSKPMSLSKAHDDSSAATATSVEAAAKRLEDLRFPSFLPTKAKLSNEAATSSQVEPTKQTSNQAQQLRSPNLYNGHPAGKRVSGSADLVQQATSPSQNGNQQRPALVAKVVSHHRLSSSGSCSNSNSRNSSSNSNLNLNLQQQQRSGATSSSLLNLTSAKFAAANLASNGQQQSSKLAGQVHQAKQQQQQHQLSQLLPAKGAVSSNTITKQRAAKPGNLQAIGSANKAPAITLSELADHSKLSERSLPSEGGHVRARIRKMEQQQSTPNLNILKPSQAKVNAAAHQQQPASGRPGRLAGSLIPVTMTSAQSALTSKLAVGIRQQQRQQSGTSQSRASAI